MDECWLCEQLVLPDASAGGAESRADAAEVPCWLVMESFICSFVSNEELDAHQYTCEWCDEAIWKLLGITAGSRCDGLWGLLLTRSSVWQAPRQAVDAACLQVVHFQRRAFLRTTLHAVLTMEGNVTDRQRVDTHIARCAECTAAHKMFSPSTTIETVADLGPWPPGQGEKCFGEGTSRGDS